MACGQTTPPVTKTLYADTSTYRFEPFSDWMPACGLDTVTALLRLKGIPPTGAFTAAPAYQLATTRTDDADDWSLISGATERSSEGDYCDSGLDVSSGTAGKFFIRLGVGYKSTSSGQCDVTAQFAFNQCGKVVGGRTLQLYAHSATVEQFVEMTPWIPAVAAYKVRAATQLTSTTGSSTFKYGITYRTATASPEDADAWDTTLDTPVVSTTPRCTSDLAIPSSSTDNKMWIQFGIRYLLANGSTMANGTVSAAFAVRAA